MIEAIKKLIDKWACHHVWELKGTIKLYWEGEHYNNKFLFICRKCGKMKWVTP